MINMGKLIWSGIICILMYIAVSSYNSFHTFKYFYASLFQKDSPQLYEIMKTHGLPPPSPYQRVPAEAEGLSHQDQLLSQKFKSFFHNFVEILIQIDGPDLTYDLSKCLEEIRLIESGRYKDHLIPNHENRILESCENTLIQYKMLVADALLDNPDLSDSAISSFLEVDLMMCKIKRTFSDFTSRFPCGSMIYAAGFSNKADYLSDYSARMFHLCSDSFIEACEAASNYETRMNEETTPLTKDILMKSCDLGLDASCYSLVNRGIISKDSAQAESLLSASCQIRNLNACIDLLSSSKYRTLALDQLNFLCQNEDYFACRRLSEQPEFEAFTDKVSIIKKICFTGDYMFCLKYLNQPNPSLYANQKEEFFRFCQNYFAEAPKELHSFFHYTSPSGVHYTTRSIKLFESLCGSVQEKKN